MTAVSVATTIIVWYHIISHVAIFICDYTQVIGLIDFVTRYDGSASDPNELLPMEMVYAGVTAMSFSTIAAGYVLAWFFRRDCLGFAAALSVWFHGLWTMHMWWRWDAWRGMMHPDGTMTPEFFLLGHVMWTITSALLLFLPTPKREKIE